MLELEKVLRRQSQTRRNSEEGFQWLKKLKRLEEEKARLESEVARCEKMLSNPGFVNKAPEKKYSDEDLNAILDKRFARWKADQEKEKAEAKRLAEMNAQERAEAERDKVQKELDELKAKNAIAEMTNEARKMCAEHDINVGDDLLSVLVNKDADKTKKAVDAFVKMFESEVEKAVKEKLKGNGPKRGGSNKGVTRESILNITDPMERQRMIAENMDLFQ